MPVVSQSTGWSGSRTNPIKHGTSTRVSLFVFKKREKKIKNVVVVDLASLSLFFSGVRVGALFQRKEPRSMGMLHFQTDTPNQWFGKWKTKRERDDTKNDHLRT
mmetsp:Transcript_15285/g.38608  ORF Transcript_15285/g.38608 Transcript_15285/m.38608 type:complete len:104 (+) Transcript_15285:2208-2519(+)